MRLSESDLRRRAIRRRHGARSVEQTGASGKKVSIGAQIHVLGGRVGDIDGLGGDGVVVVEGLVVGLEIGIRNVQVYHVLVMLPLNVVLVGMRLLLLLLLLPLMLVEERVRVVQGSDSGQVLVLAPLLLGKDGGGGQQLVVLPAASSRRRRLGDLVEAGAGGADGARHAVWLRPRALVLVALPACRVGVVVGTRRDAGGASQGARRRR